MIRPPQLPPRTPSMVALSEVGRAGVGHMSDSTIHYRNQFLEQKEAGRKKVPPPKPPRPILQSGDSWEDLEIDKNIQDQSSTVQVILNGTGSSETEFNRPLTAEVKLPVSPLNETRPCSSNSDSKDNMAIQLRPRPPEVVGEAEDTRFSSCASSASPTPPPSSSSSFSGKRPRITSLISMFEKNSPSTSPTKTMTLLPQRELSRRTERSNSFGTTSSKKNVLSPGPFWMASGPIAPSLEDDAEIPPVPPPKPKLTIPPLPPRPLSTECGEKGVPIVPPRTPAPRLPPKPPGSKPPIVGPRMSHRRSLSDSDPLMSQAHENILREK